VTADELFAELGSIRDQVDPRTREALAKFERQLKVYVAERDRELAAKDQEIAANDKELAAKDEEIAQLKDQLAGKDRVTRASPTDLAKSFRAVIDEFQAEARQADDVGVAIKALDLEVKGLVEVDEQATMLVLPSAGATVDPTALSTLRVSFAAVPVVPAEGAPPAPTEPRAPRRRRRS
jgi:hypothetical protein